MLGGFNVSDFLPLQDVEKGGAEDVEEEAMVTEGKRSVMLLSDSHISSSAKHKPVQEEEELAALLLAKVLLIWQICFFFMKTWIILFREGFIGASQSVSYSLHLSWLL